MYDLSGKVAIVTGAARKRGLGRVIAHRLAREGADVVVVGRKYDGGDKEMFLEEERQEHWKGVESVVTEIRSMGRRSIGVRADVTVNEDVENLVQKGEEEFGRIDILVNNAAYNWPHRGDQPMFTPLLDLPENVWDKMINVNLKGAFLCCKAAARRMVARGCGGKIVNISSRAGKMGIAGLGAYCTSKFGLNGLTQALAIELAPHKIYVNAVCPGRIRTEQYGLDMVSELAQQKGISVAEVMARVDSEVIPFIPLGRVAEPEEVAGVVAFLCSSESDYMTGQAINVTGGRVMH